MHKYIDFGFMTLPSMGVCILVGTIIALTVLFLIKRYSNLTSENLIDGVLWAVICGFVGMKVLFWIVEPSALTLSTESWGAFFTSLGTLLGEGMVFYGGLLGGIGGILLVCWRKKKNFFTFSDLLAPCFCLAHAGGRVGCHLSGCCYGMACESPISVFMHNANRLPTQLMEATFLVLLCIVLVLILRKNKHRGTVTAWYLILYAGWRFIIEFFRDDDRGMVGALSTSQFIGIFIFIGGLVILILSRRWSKDLPLSKNENALTGNSELPLDKDAPNDAVLDFNEPFIDVSNDADQISNDSTLDADNLKIGEDADADKLHTED